MTEKQVKEYLRRVQGEIEKKEAIEKLAETSREFEIINADLKQLNDDIQNSYDLLNNIGNSRVSAVMIYKWLSGMTFEEIAIKMGTSTRSVYRLHKKGLEILSKIL